jgi:hypothetical protein
MFVSQCPYCCFEWCPECVPHFQPPTSVTLEIHPGKFNCPSLPAGVLTAIESMCTMTLTLSLQGEWRPGYDPGAPLKDISYYLEFTPTGATQTYRAMVLIICNRMPRVGWDNGQIAPTAWAIPGYSDYQLFNSGWGWRTANSAPVNYQIPEASDESTPILHCAELCHPTRMYDTKDYWWDTWTNPEKGGYIQVKKVSTGQVFVGDFDEQNWSVPPPSDCAYMHVTVPPSTLPWDNPFT